MQRITPSRDVTRSKLNECGRTEGRRETAEIRTGTKKEAERQRLKEWEKSMTAGLRVMTDRQRERESERQRERARDRDRERERQREREECNHEVIPPQCVTVINMLMCLSSDKSQPNYTPWNMAKRPALKSPVHNIPALLYTPVSYYKLAHGAVWAILNRCTLHRSGWSGC